MKSTTLFPSSLASLLPFLLATLTTLTTADSCNVKSGVTLTSYGSGSTPGKVVYPNFACAPGSSNKVTAQPGSVQGGSQNTLTSGDGSYNNPATMATALDNPQIKPCDMVYVPWLKKYFKFADRCEQCTTDLASGTWHLDLWTGPEPSAYTGGGELGTCESKWGSSTHSIVLNPGPDLPVSTDPMDDGTTCYSPLDPVKRVFDENNFSCSGGGSSSGSGSGSGSGASPSPSSTAPAAAPASSAAAVYVPPAPSPSPSTFSTVVVPSSSSSAASSSSSAASSSSGSYHVSEKATVKGGASAGGQCSTYNDCNPGNKDLGLICVCGQCVKSDSSDFKHCGMWRRS